MMKPILLDLFCGAGGAAMGYHRAGYHVVGVDAVPQPNYLFEFIQGDALDVHGPWWYRLGKIDAVHASPPCHAYSTVTPLKRREGRPELIAPIRAIIRECAVGVPYVIENVPQAPLTGHVIQLCGSSFGLNVRRHRIFECEGFPATGRPCEHGWQDREGVVGVYGSGNKAEDHHMRKFAMQIGWMTPRELTQAIPPAYTEYIGKQMLNAS